MVSERNQAQPGGVPSLGGRALGRLGEGGAAAGRRGRDGAGPATRRRAVPTPGQPALGHPVGGGWGQPGAAVPGSATLRPPAVAARAGARVKAARRGGRCSGWWATSRRCWSGSTRGRCGRCRPAGPAAVRDLRVRLVAGPVAAGAGRPRQRHPAPGRPGRPAAAGHGATSGSWPRRRSRSPGSGRGAWPWSPATPSTAPPWSWSTRWPGGCCHGAGSTPAALSMAAAGDRVVLLSTAARPDRDAAAAGRSTTAAGCGRSELPGIQRRVPGPARLGPPGRLRRLAGSRPGGRPGGRARVRGHRRRHRGRGRPGQPPGHRPAVCASRSRCSAAWPTGWSRRPRPSSAPAPGGPPAGWGTGGWRSGAARSRVLARHAGRAPPGAAAERAQAGRHPELDGAGARPGGHPGQLAGGPAAGLSAGPGTTRRSDCGGSG